MGNQSRSRGNALGGISAQASQALSALVLQVLTARLLGADGLGTFAALYAFVVLATAVVGGFVGDSLTVLPRHRPDVRSALQIFWLGISTGMGAVVALGAWLLDFVDLSTALGLGAATTAFVMQDAIRRLLMATFNFWRIVVMDMVSLGAAVSYLVAVSWAGVSIGLRDLLLALAVGQALSLSTGLLLLPAQERWLGPWIGAAYREVASYGAWRALQQVIRPSMMAAVRVGCVVIVSASAAGELEAARIYMAPSMIVIAGVNSVLFARYAGSRGEHLRSQVRLVDRNVGALLAVVAALCGFALALLPWAGHLVTGGEYQMSAVAVAAWAGFSAATAASTPYGQLLAVRGHHVAVLLIRLVDSASAAALVVLLLPAGLRIEWVPAVLAICTIGGGVVMRWRLAVASRQHGAGGSS